METPEYTLPGVMNYLQSEFTQIEKMKINNNLELSEMKFKIAKLEGVKNSLNISNNKLVADMNNLKTDNTKLLKVIQQLKKENTQLKSKIQKFETKDLKNKTESDSDSAKEEEKSEIEERISKEAESKIDEELRDLIQGLTSTKSQSILIKDINQLNLETVDSKGRDIVSTLDLSPLVTSRKFLQDCMKEMFYLIKHGNGNIVNNINDFNFDNNYNVDNNGTQKSLGSVSGDNNSFNLFDKYDYAAVDRKNNDRSEDGLETKLFGDDQQLQQKNTNNNSSYTFASEKNGLQKAGETIPGLDSASTTSSSTGSGSLFDKSPRNSSYTNSMENSDSRGTQFTLLLRSPELLEYSKLNPAEGGDKPKIREAPQIKPKSKLQEDSKNNNFDGYYDPDGASDVDTIIEEDEENEELNNKRENSDDDSILDSPKKREIQLDIIEEQDNEENESEYLVKLKADDDSTHSKIEPAKKYSNPRVSGIIEKLEINEKTNEIITYSSGQINVSNIEKNNLNVINDESSSLKIRNGKILIRWVDDSHFLVFNDNEPYNVKIYNKKTLKEIAKINVLDDLKKEQKKNKNSENYDDDDDDDYDDSALLPLRDTTILSVDYHYSKRLLLLNCNKFYYVYNLEKLTSINLLKLYNLDAQPGLGFSSLKLGKFISDKEILVLSHNGILKRIAITENLDHIIFTINDLPSHKSIRFSNFFPIHNKSTTNPETNYASQLIFMFENVSKFQHIYRLFDLKNNKLIDDSAIIVEQDKTKRLAQDANEHLEDPINPNQVKPFYDSSSKLNTSNLFIIENSLHSSKELNLIDFNKRQLISIVNYYDIEDVVNEENEAKYDDQHLLIDWFTNDKLLIAGNDSTIRELSV